MEKEPAQAAREDSVSARAAVLEAFASLAGDENAARLRGYLEKVTCPSACPSDSLLHSWLKHCATVLSFPEATSGGCTGRGRGKQLDQPRQGQPLHVSMAPRKTPGYPHLFAPQSSKRRWLMG